MKKRLRKYSKRIKGFTLMELLIVFAIIGVLTAVSIASFGSYTSSQTFGTGVSEFSNFLSITRAKSISQVKPSVCGSSELDGYQVLVTISGSNYEQDVVCGGTSYTITKKQLPNQLTFVSGSAVSITFDVSTGTVQYPGDIAITGLGKTSTFAIDKIGNISLTNGLAITPMPTPPSPTATSIPLPTATPVPTAIPTSTPTSIPTSVPTSIPTPTPTPTPTQIPPPYTVAFSASPNPVSYHNNITLKATVTTSGCTISGQIYFFVNGTFNSNLGTPTLSGGTATVNPGSHLIGSSNNTYPVYAQYHATGGTCLSGLNSQTINITITP